MQRIRIKTYVAIAAGLFAIGALGLAAAPARAQLTFASLHSFSAVNPSSYPYENSDGAYPNASLCLGSDGNLYGTTEEGGSTGYGTIFAFAPTTGTLTRLHCFGDGTVANDGAFPESALIQGKDGNFYGTTNNGGTNGDGTVFATTPSGNSVQIRVDFIGANGANPVAGLCLGNDGDFYGTTYGGSGTVFKTTPSGAQTTLAEFSNVNLEGGVIQGSDGNFYGTTQNGGVLGYGTVFKMTQGGALTTLVNFNGTNGAFPCGALIQGNDGNFYGTTAGVSYEGGTVFKVTPGGALTVLVNFTGADGALPECALIQGSDGNFYGTTFEGGAFGYGTVFETTPVGVLTTLVNFTGNSGAYPGANPVAGLCLGSDGNFYGTTSTGGSGGDGTVFALVAQPSRPVSVAVPSYTVIEGHSLTLQAIVRNSVGQVIPPTSLAFGVTGGGFVSGSTFYAGYAPGVYILTATATGSGGTAMGRGYVTVVKSILPPPQL